MNQSNMNQGSMSHGGMSQAMFNDQDRLEDLISQEKYMINSYGSFIPEATCPQLRQVLTDNITECFQSQYDAFNQMDQRGWYPAKNAPTPEVEAAKQKFTQMKQQLG